MKCLKTVKPTEDNAVYLYMLKKEEEGKAKNEKKIVFFCRNNSVRYIPIMFILILLIFTL